MIELLNWVFAGWVHFLGVIALLAVVFAGLAHVAAALRSGRVG